MNEIPETDEPPGAVGEHFHLPERVSSVMGQPVPGGVRPLGNAALAAAYALDEPIASAVS